jgi:hypothetical protein
MGSSDVVPDLRKAVDEASSAERIPIESLSIALWNISNCSSKKSKPSAVFDRAL